MNDLPLLRSTSQLRSRIRSWRAFGETVALAPLSWPLHEGQLAVVRSARAEADRALAALSGWDGDPTWDEARAAQLLDESGADALYLPSREALVPERAVVQIAVPGLTDVLEGEDDPGAFAGFALSSVRLFSQAQADVAVYSELDWQSLAIMRRVARDLDLPTEVRAVPAERDDDGIAWSAGAQGLSDSDRPAARRLWRELTRAAQAIAAGADPDATLDDAADALADAGAEVEYLELRDAETLEELSAPGAHPARIFCAIALGGTRLIDTVAVSGDDPL